MNEIVGGGGFSNQEIARAKAQGDKLIEDESEFRKHVIQELKEIKELLQKLNNR